MPSSKLVIAFPVLDEAEVATALLEKGARGRVILLQMTPIGDVRPGHPPTQCKVTGMDEAGRLWHFGIPLRLWEEKRRNAVYFVEAEGVRGPQGSVTATEANKKILVG